MDDFVDEQEGRRRLKVADRARLAQQRLEHLRAEAEADHLAPPRPVQEKSRALAKNAWGKAWVRQLAYCEERGLYLARGRSLLRHGCVLDLHLDKGRVDALVSGEEIYEVHLKLDLPDEESIQFLKESCSSRIDSFVSLLEGRVDESVMAQLCEPEAGLLAQPHEWHMNCNCPDWNDCCEHVAAVIYAIACVIDADALAFFTLRGLNAADFCQLALVDETAFDIESLSATFGIDLDALP